VISEESADLIEQIRLMIHTLYQVLTALHEPMLHLSIQAHVGPTKNPERAMKVSQARAQEVAKWLTHNQNEQGAGCSAVVLSAVGSVSTNVKVKAKRGAVDAIPRGIVDDDFCLSLYLHPIGFGGSQPVSSDKLGGSSNCRVELRLMTELEADEQEMEKREAEMQSKKAKEVETGKGPPTGGGQQYKKQARCVDSIPV
jgi:hypothetical protein